MNDLILIRHHVLLSIDGKLLFPSNKFQTSRKFFSALRVTCNITMLIKYQRNLLLLRIKLENVESLLKTVLFLCPQKNLKSRLEGGCLIIALAEFGKITSQTMDFQKHLNSISSRK